MPRIELAGGFGQDSALQFNAENSANMYPMLYNTDGGKGRIKLKYSAGMVEFASRDHAYSNPNFHGLLGTHVTSSGRLFYMVYNGSGPTFPYLVSLYEVTGEDTIELRGGVSFADKPLNTRMADNGVVISIVTTLEDSSSSIGHFYTLATDVLADITDPDYPDTVFDVTYKDTYFIWLDADSNRFYMSDSQASDVASCVNALDFGTVESNPDVLTAVKPIGNEIAIFGTETIEFFYNSGNVDFPFERNSGVTQEVGTRSKLSIQKLNNVIVFIGTNKDGFGVVYLLDGYTPKRISTHSIERKILESGEIEGIYSYAYQDEGNYFYTIVIPDLVILSDEELPFTPAYQYNLSTGLWNELLFSNAGNEQFVIPLYHEFAFDKNLVFAETDSGTGTKYIDCVALENGVYKNLARFDTALSPVSVYRYRTITHLSRENRDVVYKSFELDIQKDVANGDDADPTISISMSKDGGMIYGTPKVVRIGGTNAQQRVRIKRLGRGRDVVFKIESNSPVQQEWFTAYLEYEVLDD
jgi:hypothetical protein